MPTGPTARVLALLALFQARPEWSLPGLAERLGSSERTVRRDIQRLREMGYLVDANPGPGSRYRLRPGPIVPPLLFDADEVAALVSGLAMMRARATDDDAAVTAMVKLEQVLPARVRHRLHATRLAIDVLQEPEPGGSAAISASAVGVVADAIADAGRIRFSYRDRDDVASDRTVDPHRHVLRHGRWYLVGFDVDRDGWRVFRFDRVTEVERVVGTFTRRELPARSIADWFASDFGRHGGS